MKKAFSKSLSWLLSVVMIFSIFVVGLGTITANAMTMEQFNARLAQLQQKYPTGYVWKDTYHGTDGDWVQCKGFAHLMGYEVFGVDPGEWIIDYDLTHVEPGDIVQYGEYPGINHTVFCTSVSGDTFYFVDCNGNGNRNADGDYEKNLLMVLWGDKASISARSLYGGSHQFNYIRKSPIHTVNPVLDTVAPTITNARAESVSSTSFNIKCSLSDNIGVTRVWLVIYGPNGEKQFGVSASNGDFSYTINTTDYGGSGDYAFHIYAFDAAENSTKAVVEQIQAVDTPTGHVMSESEAAGQTIPDGDYYIVNEIGADYFIDIPGNDFDTPNGANIQMWTWGSSIPDIGGYDCFHFEYLNNGFYRISQINTNMCLDLFDNSLLRGANVQMWQKYDNNAQQWSIEKTSHGYRLRARCNAYYLDVLDGKHEPGTNVRCWEGNNSKAQSFSFIPRDLNEKSVSDGVYIIRPNVSNQHFLDVSGTPDEFHESSNVQIWKSTDSDEEEKYEVKYVGDGWYKIIETTSGLVVEVADIENDFLNEFKNVQIAVDNGGKNQLWKIKKNSDGTYFIINKASGYYLDLYFAKTDNGTNVSQILYNGNSSQRWILEPITYEISYNMNGGNGSIGNQIKNYGQDLTLSATVPSRTDYKFVGWNTDKNATTAKYQPSGKYTANSNATLYAIWAVNHNYTAKIIAPTCTEKGYTLHTCTNCGDNYKDTYVNALGHDYKLTSEKAATCTTDGEKIYTCSRCGGTKTETVKATGHSYTTKVVAPTCTAKGYTLHTCKNCNDSYKDTYTNALGHDYKLTSEKVATCTTDGEKIYTCSRCGDTKTETVKATGHSYTTKVIAPTCTEKGYTLHTCSKCGDNYKDTYTNATGHKYEETIVTPTTTEQGYTLHTCSVCKHSYKDNYTNILLSNNSTLSADTIKLGETIIANAKATGGTGEYLYQVVYKQTTQSKWTTAQSYKVNATVTFKPANAVTYDVCVKVKDSNNTEVKKFFTVKVTSDELKNVSTISAQTINLGSTVTVNAKATGSTGFYTYAVYYKQKAQTKWTTKQDFKANNTIAVKPAKSTTYDICVKVKDDKGTIVKKYFTVNVTDFTNTSTLSATEIKLGNTVKVSCSATGSTGYYQYAVYYKKTSDTKWTTKQSYSSNNTVTIKPAKATTYDVCVKVKDNKNNEVKKYFTVTVK